MNFESPLSRPVPSETCICLKNDDPDVDMLGGGDPAPINHEELVLNEVMKKLTLSDQFNAEQTVLGYSEEVRNILNRRLMSSSTTGLAEDEKLLSQMFQQLEWVIKNFENSSASASDPNFAAYKMAREQDPTYINHPLFKIGFLRAENYDAEQAALRIFKYLRIKLDLFGLEKLTRDVLLDDLGEDGKRYLELGGLQVLPKRDRAGRRVMFGSGVLKGGGDEREILAARKAFFYFWTSLGEDDTEEGRVKGIVGILWRVHKPPLPNPAAAELLRQIWQSVPVKISAYHLCYGNRSFDIKTLDAFAKMSLAWFKNKHDMRYRRAHFGESMECMYTMMSKYGVPSECFPLNHASPANGFVAPPGQGSDSNVPIFHDYHARHWMARRKLIDQKKLEIMLNSIKTSNRTSVTASGNSRLSLGASVFDSLMGSQASMGDSFNNELTDILIGGPKKDSLRMSDTSMASTLSKINGIFTPHGDNNDSLVDILDEALGNTMEMAVRDSDIESRDIKLGRGKPLQRHPGNITFRNLIHEQFETYDKLDKRGQTDFSIEILNYIKKEGTRFWKEKKDQKGYWEEVDDEEAREKIAINFRTERKRRKTQKE